MSIKQPELYGKRFIQGHIDELNDRTERQILTCELTALGIAAEMSASELKRKARRHASAATPVFFLIIFSFQCFLDYLRNHSRNIAFKLRHFFYCTAF